MHCLSKHHSFLTPFSYLEILNHTQGIKVQNDRWGGACACGVYIGQYLWHVSACAASLLLVCLLWRGDCVVWGRGFLFVGVFFHRSLGFARDDNGGGRCSVMLQTESDIS